MGSAAGAGLVQILTESDISDPMQPVLNCPMTFGPSGQFGGLGVLSGEGTDRVDELATWAALVTLGLVVLADRAGGADDLDRLGGVGKPEPGRDGDCFQGSFLDPPVTTPVAVCPIGISVQGSALSLACRVGWLPLTVTSRWAPRLCRYSACAV